MSSFASLLARGLRRGGRLLVYTGFILGVTVFSCITTVFLLLQYTGLGTYGAAKLTDWLHERYGVQLQIGRVSMGFPASVELQETLVYDLRGDTLLCASRASTSLLALARMGRELHFGQTELHDASLRIRVDSAGVINITEFFNVFKSAKPKTNPKRFELSIDQINFSDTRFSLQYVGTVATPGRFNHRDISFSELHGTVHHLRVASDTVRMEISGLHFREKSGFAAQEFQTRMSLCSHHLHFQDIELREGVQHLRVSDFRMDFDGFAAMKDFVHNVRLSLAIEPSVLTPRLFSYFVPRLRPSDLPLYATGYAAGTIASLQVHALTVGTGTETRLRLQSSFEGLPKVHDAMVHLEVKECRTSLEDVRMLTDSLGLAHFTLPDFARRLQRLAYKGELVGFLDDFVAYGTLTSNLGNVGVDLSLRIDPQEGTAFDGKISTQRLHVGQLIHKELLGHTDLKGSIEGVVKGGGKLHARTQISIDNLEFKNYTYHHIDLDGDVTPKSYSGHATVRDSALQLSFTGELDFSDSIPQYQFAAQAPHIDLKRLHWYEKDSVAQLSFDVNAFYEGKNLDELLGSISFSELRYTNPNGTLSLDGLRISAFNDGGGKSITADSRVFRASMWTDQRYDHLVTSLRALLEERLPAYFGCAKEEECETTALIPSLSFPSSTAYALPPKKLYRATLLMGECEEFFSTLLPTLTITPRSELQFTFDAASQALEFRVRSKRLGYRNAEATEIALDLLNQDTLTQFNLAMQHGSVGTLALDSLTLQTHLRTDHLSTTLALLTPDMGGGALRLCTTTQFYPKEEETPFHFITRVEPSKMQLQGRDWQFSRAHIYTDTSRLEINNFNIRHEDRRLSLVGGLSQRAHDTLRLTLDNIDLGVVEKILPRFRYQGKINGYIGLVSPLKQLNIFTRLQLSNFSLNDTYIGNSELLGRWAGLQNPFLLRFQNRTFDGEKDITLNASWSMEGRGVEGRLQLNKCRLALLDLFAGQALASTGSVNADLRLYGSVQKPHLEGEVAFNEANFTLKQFGTQITTRDRVRLHNDAILFENFTAHDPQAHELQLQGKIDISELSEPVFDLTAITQQFRVLQTQASAELYYGRLFMSSLTHVRGTLAQLRLETALRTEPGTQLYFQLPTYSEAKENQLLEFVDPRDTAQRHAAPQRNKREKKASNHHSFRIDLNVTNDALTQLLVNPRTGDMLRCRGEGSLRIESVPNSSEVRVFGDYTIQRGEYTSVLQGVLSKKFKIQAGSVIRFSGAPEAGQAQIAASYRVKAALDRLFPSEASEKYKRRVPVDCKILIEGSLQAPRIQFQIDVPQADPETQSLLAAALNTEEKVMRQFASLLFLNSFVGESRGQAPIASAAGSNGTTPTPQNNDESSNNALLSSFWELLFNNLNSWIAQIENAPSIDLGFNYRPGDAYTKDEAEVSVSMQWFDGRLNVDANWDVNRNNTTSAVAGDINVTQQSMAFKNLQYKAFARSNDNLVFSDLSPYTAGAGIVLSDSFDSIGELLKRLKALFSRKKNKTETPPELDTDTNEVGNDS